MERALPPKHYSKYKDTKINANFITASLGNDDDHSNKCFSSKRNLASDVYVRAFQFRQKSFDSIRLDSRYRIDFSNRFA